MLQFGLWWASAMYDFPARLLHRLALGNPAVLEVSFALERRLFAVRSPVSGAVSHVFVSGFARSQDHGADAGPVRFHGIQRSDLSGYALCIGAEYMGQDCCGIAAADRRGGKGSRRWPTHRLRQSGGLKKRFFGGQPATRAAPTLRAIIAIGKFQGVMRAQTRSVA